MRMMNKAYTGLIETRVVFEWVQLDTEGKIGKRLIETRVVFESRELEDTVGSIYD